VGRRVDEGGGGLRKQKDEGKGRVIERRGVYEGGKWGREKGVRRGGGKDWKGGRRKEE